MPHDSGDWVGVRCHRESLGEYGQSQKSSRIPGVLRSQGKAGIRGWKAVPTLPLWLLPALLRDLDIRIKEPDGF